LLDLPFKKLFANLSYTLIVATSLLASIHTMGETFSLLDFTITVLSRDKSGRELLCTVKALILRRHL